MRKILAVLALSLLASVSYAQDSITFWPPLPGSSITGPLLLSNGTAAAPSLSFSSDPDTGLFWNSSGNIALSFNNSESGRLRVTGYDIYHNSASITMGTSTDVVIARDAANTLAIRNGGTAGTPVPQSFNVYNFCDGAFCATGYESLRMYWTTNTAIIGTSYAGTGSQRALQVGNGFSSVIMPVTMVPDSTDSKDFGDSRLWRNGYIARSVQGSKSKSLTDAGAAVSIWRIAVPTNGYAGGDVIFTANSTDGTNRLTTTGRVTFAGADTTGTVTCGIGTPYALATAYRRANTLLCTFTAVTSTTNCDIQVTCTDNLAAAQTMAIESRLDMPTPNTITPQ